MEEKATLRVEIDGQDAKTTLQELQAESKEITKELRRMKDAGEEGSEGWKALKIQQKGVNDEMMDFTRHLDVNDASMRELAAKSRLLNAELRNLKVGSQEWLEKLSEVREVDDKIDEVKKSVKGLGDEVEKQPSMWEGMKGSILAVFTGTGLLELVKAAGTAIWDFGKEIFETTAKFEKYDAVLKVALGSQEKSTEAMENLKTLAAKLPFSMDELTESYVKFVNRGLTPTMDEMTKLADIAASQGKGFDQLAEALLDATTGEFERLKEFGIQATKANGEVELSFKGVTKVVKDQPEAIRNAILAFGELEGVQGVTAEMSKNLSGKFSNLNDNADALKIAIGENLKPVFYLLLDVISGGLEILTGFFIGLGRIGGFISENQELFIAFGTAILSLNAANIAASASALYHVAVEEGRAIATRASAATQWLLNAAMTANPIGLVVAAIASLVGGFVYLYNHSESVRGAVGALWGGFKSLIGVFKDIGTAIANLDFSDLWKKLTNGFVEVGKGAKQGYTDAIKKGHEEVVVDHKKSLDKMTGNHAKSQGDMTLAEKKEEDKRAKARDKQAKIDANAKKKQTKIDEKLDDKTRDDKLKAETDLTKTIETMNIKAIKDDRTRKIAELNFQIKEKLAANIKSLASDKLKEEMEVALIKEQVTETFKINEEFRIKDEASAKTLKDKTAAEEKRLRDERLKGSKELFDAEFQAEVAKAKNALDLTSENSKAQWDAKRNLLDTEFKFKIQQLQNEDAAEKARIAESIKDNTERNRALDAADVELKAKMSSAEIKLQNEKTKLNEEQNKARQKNNDEFFDVLKKAGNGDLKSTLEFLKKKGEEEKIKNKDSKEDKVKLMDAFKGLMQGDTTLFMKFMGQKVKTDADGNATQLQQFSDKTQKVADMATKAIGFLKDLNQKYLEWEISKIKKEETEQLASWKREYDSGKISKEEFEKGNVRITKESKEKELAARKDAFEREKKMNIAAAVINTAQAALKSFAMFGFPIGLIMAALAVVAGGIQIAAISRQQFTGAKGGVVNSVGKIFAQSGAVVPRNAFVAQGDSHGSSYGMGGISMVNRRTGREVGEIEGGEPVMVLSKNTYQNNGKLIDQLLHSSLYKNGAPISMARGGVMSASGVRMYEDGGVVDTGANVDEMMSENKKSQETMEKTRDNTAKTFEGVENLTRVMQRSQQQGGANIAYMADAILRELQHMGRVMQGVERAQMNTNTDLGNKIVSTFELLKSNHASLSDTVKSKLQSLEMLIGKNANNDRSQLENLTNSLIAFLRSSNQSLIQTVRNEGNANRDLSRIHRSDERNQTENFANMLFLLLRNNQQSSTQIFRNEMRITRELDIDIFEQSTQQSARHFAENAGVLAKYHLDNFRQHNNIATAATKQIAANENARHQDAMGEMMLMRMISNELNYHSSLLNNIANKSDGTGSILHAISRIQEIALKSNLI